MKSFERDVVAKFGSVDHKLQGPAPQDHWIPPSPDKTVTLTLSWITAANCYKVITVTNTSYYKPDQWIKEEDLAKIAAMPRWQFSVTSPDYIGMLLGLVKNMPMPMIPIP